jgi:tRNA(Ile)-lysidine synthase
MLKDFQDYIKTHHLLQPGAKVIVALSSGIDSMVLLNLLIKSGFKVEIAHCNFGLRGKEADADQLLAKETAFQYNTPFHTIKFDTYHFAHEHKISTQMAARELRYKWFQEIVLESQAEAIAVAHHKDDQIETQLLNLIRGTGFAGLRGMKNKRGNIVRPLLFSTRKDIERFAQENNIKWREDASNNKTTYKRNFIRHKLTPLLEKLNPSYRQAFNKLETYATWAEKEMESKRFLFQKKCFTLSGDDLYIYLMKWHSLSESEFFVPQALSSKGFNALEISTLFRNYPPQVGTTISSATHRLVVNRDHWLISPNRTIEESPTYILQGNEGILENDKFRLQWKIVDSLPFPAISHNATEATLEIPLTADEISVRYWQEGDRFIPLGMSGEKKLSDFFIDNKIDLNKKTEIPLLCIDQKIAWVCGLRPSDAFKMTNSPKKVLWIQFTPCN